MGNFESTESFSTATGASAVAATTPATARTHTTTTHTTQTTHTTAVAATSPTNTTARTPKTATRKRTVEATNSPAFETPAPQDNEWLQIYSPSRTPAVGRFRDSEFYLDGKVLGQGSFARVQLATHLPTAKKVAVKVIDKTRIPENMRAYAAREPGVLCNLKHPNVVKLLHTSESEREINIFLQFMEGCDMHSYIEQHRFLEEQEARRLFVQIVDAVQYIHKQNVCHRDLKLENILVSKSKRNGAHRAMVIDFGFASVIPSADHLFTDHPGSVCYAAPELLRGDAYDGRKVDVYALGVTLFTMLHGRYPFYSTDNKKLYEMIWKDIPQCAIDLSEPVRQLVMWMLDKNPRSRPTMEQVKSHPWMSGVLNPYTATRSEAIASPINRLKKTISKRLSPQTPRRRLFQ